MDVDIAIIGGGPAGLAAALALRRVLDPNTCIAVFEARVPSGERGAMVSLAVNGLRALEAVDPGVVHRLYQRAIYSSCLMSVDECSGQRLPREWRVDHRANLQQHGHASITLHWWQITDTLQQALPEGTVHVGLKLQGCEELAAAVGEAQQQQQEEHASGAGPGYRYRLEFKRASGSAAAAAAIQQTGAVAPAGGDGGGGGGGGHYGASTLSVRAKWLIGADGYFSRVRRMVGDALTPTFTGEVCWWGSVTAERLAAAGSQWPEPLRDMAGSRAMSVGYVPVGHLDSGGPRFGLIMRSVVGDGEAGAAAGGGGGGAEAEAEGGGASWPVAFWYLRTGVEELRRAGLEYPCGEAAPGEFPALGRALTMFAHLPPDALSIIRATDPARVTERGVYRHDYERGAFTNGRGMVLLGDAAHAGRPDGQGTNLALEDAVVLAAAVRDHGLGEEAFAAYEAAQTPRVRAILSDTAPPFAVRVPLVNAASFAPLWAPADLHTPVPMCSAEEVLAWSRERVRLIVDEKVGAAAEAAAGAKPAPAQQQ